MFKHSDFKGKKACVLGLGKSGISVAHLLAKKGFKFFISDAGNVSPHTCTLCKNI
jgi:UDP-N-acetylmuramoylalanine-D-glutamate ligase